MKRFTLLAALGLCSISLFAQDAQKEEPKEEGFVFTTVKELPITSVKNQSRAGTCWCYSSMAFLESELLRMGKGEYDFSEMYIVHQTYLDRADAAVRTHGDVSFSQGGSFYDVIYGMKKFGLVPEEVMRPGVMYGDTLSNHTELTAVSDAVVAAIAKGKLRKLQTDNNHNPLWKKAIAAIHDIYLGKCPEKFTYKGKEYTPHSFFESTGLNPNDYISLTSYTHHPFYEPFVLEIQDNWRWGQSYNLPIDEFMQVFDNAINNGYPIAWGSDVSEQGFTRDGVAVMPDTEKVQELSGSDMAHWLKMKPEEKKLNTKPQPQKWCTQEERQEAYDNWETTDDHGMLIYGIAKDQEGNDYYMVKNSWGKAGKYEGLWYASKAFVRYKTMNIVVNKNALPKEIAKKLAKIAGVDIESYGKEMLKAGTDISDFTPFQVINIDSKEFNDKNAKFEISQVNAVDLDSVFSRQSELEDAINKEIKEKNLDFYMFAATDILNANSKIIALGNKTNTVEKAFGVNLDNHTALLENVVSRKKQMLPNILNNLD